MLSYLYVFPAHLIGIAITLIALLIATVTDIKHNTIPIGLFPITLVLLAIIERPTLENLLGMLIMGILFFMFAAFGNSGGGDVLMMMAIGYQLGIGPVLWCGLISYSIYAIFSVCYYWTRKKKDKNKHKQFPFAPFALIGYITVEIMFFIF